MIEGSTIKGENHSYYIIHLFYLKFSFWKPTYSFKRYKSEKYGKIKIAVALMYFWILDKIKLHFLQLLFLFQDVDKKIDGVDGVDA